MSCRPDGAGENTCAPSMSVNACVLAEALPVPWTDSMRMLQSQHVSAAATTTAASTSLSMFSQRVERERS